MLSTQIAIADIQHATLYNNAATQSAFLEDKIREYFPDETVAEVMIAIAACEASGNPRGLLIHWQADGSLLPNNQGGQARGMFQVMSRLHAPDMQQRGLDINNIDDYMTFVRYLHDRNSGYNDWYPSRGCWNPVRLAQN
tara:strand:+ start:397 stop:813 length:417 start_codon:yes stop_codon:yes gene_type:complete